MSALFDRIDEVQAKIQDLFDKMESENLSYEDVKEEMVDLKDRMNCLMDKAYNTERYCTTS